jgi:purine-nucleoside phosphorylase
MTVHLEARPGDIAPIVLLPGDPLRALFVAERFLD